MTRESTMSALNRTRRQALLAFGSALGAFALQSDEDDLLYDRVHRKLNNDRSLRIRDLKVEVRDGVVTIDGIVRSEKLKRKATRTATIKGVKRVINRLVVGA